ncbi:hypothetical protein OTB20_08375 [Streptomyces sp. H27-H1]|uniref:hypothetical protein n=1 Tax=Streptomyces sp. H27-H1 TaxID=2996461 RepID=UPI002271326F|nr:hypothetical protein [Streptomyces sp. H27-H1]MCY0926220.1 hypothetical protein [Streptomyces sp. H27-H1]
MSVPTNLLSAAVSGVETNVSGWTAGTNTTLAHSVRFYQGTRSLGLVADASGSVSAVTVARVPVEEGAEYQAYAFFTQQSSPGAARVASVRINWHTAASGGSIVSTSTGAGVTLTNDLTWNTPPPQVTAFAPAGATYATLTLTVTGLTAGAVVAADVMTLGLPTVWPNNLLPYTTASCETSTAGWGAYQNASIDRVSTDSWEGWYSLRIVATAAGAARVNTASGVPAADVTVGFEYAAVAMVLAGQDSSFIIELRWYDDGGSLVSATPATWTVTAGSWIRVTAIGNAPTGAATARIALRPTATAAGQTWLCDQMGVFRTPRLPSSVLPYNTQGMEVDASGWTAISGCGVFRSTTVAVQGAASLRITPTGDEPDAMLQMTDAVPVLPGKAYRAAMWIYHIATAKDVNVDIIFTWYDAFDGEIARGTFRWVMDKGLGWYTPVGSDVAPDAARSLRVSIRILNPDSINYYMDEVGLSRGGLGVTAVVIPSAYGAEISMQGLTTGGHTHYGLWRMREDGAITPLRGPAGDTSAIPITGDLAVAADYEAPLGIPVRYLLRAFTGSTYLQATSRPVELPEPASTDIVVKDPTEPVRQVTLTVATLPDWTRAARQGVHQICGRERPIVITDVRTSRTGTLSVVSASQAEIQQLWWVLEQGTTLLIQWPSTWGEADAYVQVGDVTEAHIVQWADYADRAWTLALTEVDRPVGGLSGSAARTWDDVATDSVDWLNVLTRYASWMNVYSDKER